jgi:ATP-binding cassette, subfamily B, bacterial
MLGEDAFAGYKSIADAMRRQGIIDAEHPERTPVSVELGDLHEQCAQWVTDTAQKLRLNNEIANEEIQEFEANAWLLFHGLAEAYNTRALVLDIDESLKETNYKDLGSLEQKEDRLELSRTLADKYSLEQEGIDLTIQLEHALVTKKPLTLAEFVEFSFDMWKRFNFKDHSALFVKVLALRLTAEGIGSAAPWALSKLGFESEKQFDPTPIVLWYILNAVPSYIHSYESIKDAELKFGIHQSINAAVYQSFFYKDLQELEELSLGDIDRIIHDARDDIEKLVDLQIQKIGPLAAKTVFTISFLALISPLLAGAGLATMPLLFALAKYRGKMTQKMAERSRRENIALETRVASIQRDMETVRTGGSVEKVEHYVRDSQRSIDRLEKDRSVMWSKFELMYESTIDQLSNIIAISTAIFLQRGGIIAPGAILSNLMYTQHLEHLVREFIHMINETIPAMMVDLRRVKDFLGKQNEVDIPGGELENRRRSVSELPNLDIIFQGASFKTKKGLSIVENASLSIKQGERVAIVGPSGEGKSTLLKLLVGLYSPTSGEITIGGENVGNIRKYGPESRSSTLVTATQMPTPLAGFSLRENILLFNSIVNEDAALERTLRDVGLEKFIGRLDEEVGKGVRMSGGERVRLGVARALVRLSSLQKGILILDEPTASLDVENARKTIEVVEQIGATYPELTIICVTHDERLQQAIEGINDGMGRVVRMQGDIVES